MTANQDKVNRHVRERISNLSDEDLLRMLDGKRSDYTPVAWDVARQEISKRGGKEAVSNRLAEKSAEEAPVEQVPTYTGEGLRCDLYNLHDYAGYWKRSFADSVDGIILAIALAFLSILGDDLAGILGLILFAAYHVGFKGARGTTPGYKILGIKIVSIDGADVTVNQIAVRQISSVFSALVLGLGYIWIAFDPRKQSWHDKVAGTYVVRTEAEPIGAIALPRRRVVRAGLFATLFAVTCLLIGGTYVAAIAISKGVLGSEAFHVSEEYLRKSPRIQQEIGAPTEFNLVGMTLSPGKRILGIRVSGERGEIIATAELDAVGERWTITAASFTDPNGNEVDITAPLVRKK